MSRKKQTPSASDPVEPVTDEAPLANVAADQDDVPDVQDEDTDPELDDFSYDAPELSDQGEQSAAASATEAISIDDLTLEKVQEITKTRDLTLHEINLLTKKSEQEARKHKLDRMTQGERIIHEATEKAKKIIASANIRADAIIRHAQEQIAPKTPV